MFGCDSFFCSAAANYIQFISAGLEIIGLTLVYVEIRHSERARSIEQKIIFASERLKGTGKELLSETASFIGVLLSGGLIFAAYHWFVIEAAEYAKTLLAPGRAFYERKVYEAYLLLAILLLIFLALLAYTLLRYVSTFTSLLSNWAHGRALGAFGFCLAVLGVIGEAYQVATIILET